MQHLEVSGAVRLIYGSLGAKGLNHPRSWRPLLCTRNGTGSCIPLAPLHERSNSTAREKLHSINNTLQDMTPSEYNASVTHITVIIMAHFSLSCQQKCPQQAVLVRYDKN
jgi:hypothetical protein